MATTIIGDPIQYNFLGVATVMVVAAEGRRTRPQTADRVGEELVCEACRGVPPT